MTPLLPGTSRLSLPPEGEGDLPSPSGERDSERSSQGEGLSRRGKTPDLLLERARRLRTDQTEAEAKLWSRLRAGRLLGIKFRRQIAFSANYIADFVCPRAKLIVELDGSQHAEQVAYDQKRTRFFESEGYRVLRFWNNDVLLNMDGVLTAIHAAVAPPLPGASRLSLPPEGEGSSTLFLRGEGQRAQLAGRGAE